MNAGSKTILWNLKLKWKKTWSLSRVKRSIKFSLFDWVKFNLSRKQNLLKKEHYVMITLKLQKKINTLNAI